VNRDKGRLTGQMKICVLFLLISLLVVTLSCVNKEVPITETYYETEYRQEPYTTTESYENKISHTGYNLLSQSGGGETYIMLNRVSDRNIKWAIVTASTQYPGVRSLSIQPSGKNHRISVSLSETNPKKLLSATMSNNRSPEGTKLGFKPKPLPPYYSEMVSNCQRAFPFMTSGQCEESVIGGAASQFGFTGSAKTVINASSADFLLDDLFNISGWALIDIMSGSSYSVDYVWDEVQMETKEVTKYRDIPVQVQKQRTVMQTKAVPFWEVFFTR
jgi:hypothetical protein